MNVMRVSDKTAGGLVLLNNMLCVVRVGNTGF